MRAAPPIIRAQIAAFSLHHNICTPKKILILPESHTQNLYYIENLYYLTQLIQKAGFETQIGWYGETSESVVHLTSETEKKLEAFPILIKDGLLSTGNFTPDLILLNNDFSSGYPKRLDGIKQLILPSHSLGWHSRKKSEHFKYYNLLAKEFAQILEIDPWLIEIETVEVNEVNFNEGLGLDRVIDTASTMLGQLKEQHKNHGVSQDPYLFIKNNHGTYGMGIMTIHSIEELKTLNRRTKNKMSTGKNKLPIDSVVIQEGIPTATLVNRMAAEPVIYLFGCELVGGFLRTNHEKNVEENLNSQGMIFKKLCMSDLKAPDECEESDLPILELVYGSIARISALATGMELAEHSIPR